MSDVKFWACPHCGNDACWFDRTIELWQDFDGKWHEEGPWMRCCKCGRADDEKPTDTKVAGIHEQDMHF